MKTKTLTKEEILHIADLAKLHLTQDEVKKFAVQLGEIIEYINTLNKLGTNKTEPTSSVTDLLNSLREDLIQESFKKDEALRNAIDKKGYYFLIKSIFE